MSRATEIVEGNLIFHVKRIGDVQFTGGLKFKIGLRGVDFGSGRDSDCFIFAFAPDIEFESFGQRCCGLRRCE